MYICLSSRLFILLQQMSTFTKLHHLTCCNSNISLLPTTNRPISSATSLYPPFPIKFTAVGTGKSLNNRKRWISKCSVSTFNPPAKDLNSDGGGYSLLDCVIVGGGISGLCIAQALETQHKDEFRNVIVTEAKERVGGNITTVERDGFLWEEGPNSFQPSDPMLTMVVCFPNFKVYCFRVLHFHFAVCI